MWTERSRNWIGCTDSQRRAERDGSGDLSERLGDAATCSGRMFGRQCPIRKPRARRSARETFANAWVVPRSSVHVLGGCVRSCCVCGPAPNVERAGSRDPAIHRWMDVRVVSCRHRRATDGRRSVRVGRDLGLPAVPLGWSSPQGRCIRTDTGLLVRNRLSTRLVEFDDKCHSAPWTWVVWQSERAG